MHLDCILSGQAAADIGPAPSGIAANIAAVLAASGWQWQIMLKP